MPWFRIIALAFVGLTSAGCASAHFGTYPGGMDDFPERPISPQQAVEAAEPYLDESYQKMRAARDDDRPGERKPSIRVKLRGKHYYVLKDDYPSMNANYGFDHAVKVSALTGEVTPPQ